MLHRTAFDRALADKTTDVRALFNHDPSMLLGRESSGTLKLSVDSEGLPFEVDLPNTSVGRDVRELAERGDLTGASFGFIPGEDEWSRTKDGRQLRTHMSVARLVDVSVVTFPAYQGAGVMLRSLTAVPESGRSQLVRARARLNHLGG
jgi:Escherichia/Staphylococcus phage prohead protease